MYNVYGYWLFPSSAEFRHFPQNRIPRTKKLSKISAPGFEHATKGILQVHSESLLIVLSSRYKSSEIVPTQRNTEYPRRESYWMRLCEWDVKYSNTRVEVVFETLITRMGKYMGVRFNAHLPLLRGFLNVWCALKLDRYYYNPGIPVDL